MLLPLKAKYIAVAIKYLNNYFIRVFKSQDGEEYMLDVNISWMKIFELMIAEKIIIFWIFVEISRIVNSSSHEEYKELAFIYIYLIYLNF